MVVLNCRTFVWKYTFWRPTRHESPLLCRITFSSCHKDTVSSWQWWPVDPLTQWPVTILPCLLLMAYQVSSLSLFSIFVAESSWSSSHLSIKNPSSSAKRHEDGSPTYCSCPVPYGDWISGQLIRATHLTGAIPSGNSHRHRSICISLAPMTFSFDSSHSNAT